MKEDQASTLAAVEVVTIPKEGWISSRFDSA